MSRDLVVSAACAFAFAMGAQSVSAQATQDEHAGHDMAQMAREGSGTSWLPDSSPMYMLHAQRGPWMLIGHENVFLQFFHESSERGGSQSGSINWVMGMAERNIARGHLALRGMFSLEPWTVRGCGYPDLLASGEQCRGADIHDHQHPHDLAMELSAEYDAPLAGTTRWQLYGGPAGEPALGPAAYPHRVSAMPNPLAPITHHSFDSTHVSFGVVTGGVYGKRWKLESSAFNGREPDEFRKDFDFGALDSVSGRLWVLPTANLALQVSAGRLKEAEAGDAAEPRRDVNKATATATYHRVRQRTVWASTMGWGRNAELGHATNAVLAETSVTLADRDTVFGRLEVARKTAHDLAFEPAASPCSHCLDDHAFTLTKIQGGYTRYANAGTFKSGVGASVSASIVPADLRTAYGSRLNMGVGVFLTLRPAATAPAVQSAGAAGAPTMVMVQTAFDPSKLTCSPEVDLSSAAKAMYDGKTYYFCSAADRDKFLTDPKMSLSMMPPKE